MSETIDTKMEAAKEAIVRAERLIMESYFHPEISEYKDDYMKRMLEALESLRQVRNTL